MSRWQRGLIYSKYDYFCLLNCRPFVTKLALIVQCHKLEYPVEKWDYRIQGQGHSRDSECHLMYVQMISSESQNIVFPNLVWWCSIMSQSVMQKFFVAATFKVKVTVWAYMIRSRKGRLGMCDVSPPCLESQGCHLIPLYYPLSCSSA